MSSIDFDLVDGGFTREEVLASREAGPPIFRSPDPPLLGPKVKLDRIVETTAVAFSFPVEELIGPRRLRPVVHARQVGMYVAVDLGFSRAVVARAFGRLDHTTVVHAINQVRADPTMLSEADQLGQYLRTLG